MAYFDNHSHTIYSNIRLLDSINRPEDVIKKAFELGLSGICITEHEVLSSHVVVNKLAEEYPNFTIGLGNEIYLTDTRDMGQKYYHFILIAKNEIGHKALKELSSQSWFYSYYDRGLERVPTLKSELSDIIKKYPNSLIATTACIGGELGTNVLGMLKAESVNDLTSKQFYYNNIKNFIEYCLNLFGEDFYIELSPSANPEQVAANKKMFQIAKFYNIKLAIGNDAHYLTAEQRAEHKAYLNSKGGEREVDAFYEYTYLKSEEEVRKLLSLALDENEINYIIDCTNEIKNKITKYSLFHKQGIPTVEVKNYPKAISKMGDLMEEKYPHLCEMTRSDDIQNRYWVNECLNKLNELDKYNDKYLSELEEEARVKSVISEKLETNMFCYPNTLQHYVDMFWECGSMVGAGRGSSCAALNHYLLGITQIDPIEWNLPFFRYLNDERVELGDIDLDLCPSKRPLILNKIKEERGKKFNSELPQWAKDNLGCTLIATFGTEGTKSAILSACRGYRSQDCPDGIDVDEAHYMSSLIPQERGFLWPINDVINGNQDKNRKPVKEFLREVDKYPGLLNIIINIEGLINHRGSHASGVILFDKDPFEHCAFMKTPNGDITTQFDLHDCEYMGLTKYDFLVTEVQDKLVQAIKLMQEDEVLEKDLTLRQIYDKYFHPNVLPLEDEKIWKALQEVSVLNTFQFDSQVGMQTAKKIKPSNILEMSAANGLMRLMGEEGEERPLDKYVRQKNDISLWYKEMTEAGLTEQEQKTLEPYFKEDYGVPPSQEQLMKMLMDKDICNFSLAEANAARKIVGKKQMSKIPLLKDQVLSSASSKKLGQYVWKHGVGPQMGYSFSQIHALAYSFIGVQTLYIATHWNPIYWNTACLIVNSGSLENNEEYELDEDEKTVKKVVSTDYSKMAKALGDIINAGIKVSLVDINKSDFSFKPDVVNNQILFGMKALSNINDDVVNQIINNRPYNNIKEFCIKTPLNRQAMISLIKSGAFDSMMDRKKCMIWYLWNTCDKKKRITLQNMGGLIKYHLLPDTSEEFITAKRVYEFNRYLKSICQNKTDKINYHLDDRALHFLDEFGYYDIDGNNYTLNIKQWDKTYQIWMDIFRKWIAENKDEILDNLNTKIFEEDWNKYAKGTISAWEMESLCFYYHEHELAHLNNNKYGFVDFYKLNEEPEIEKQYVKGDRTITIYKLNKICGTVIAKNKVKSTVSLLTTSGVVNVKFRKEYFSLFDKRISEKQADGTKKVVDKSWFTKGAMIAVQGIRSGDEFITKKYSNSEGHQLYKIERINELGELELKTERYQGDAI